MKLKTFLLFTSFFFIVVALFHLFRVLFHWEFVIGNWSPPYWINIVAFVGLTILSIVAFRFIKKL